MEKSPEFRNRMDMVFRAMDLSNPSILRSYIGLYKPSFWEERARLTKDPAVKERFHILARQMDDIGFYRQTRPIISTLCSDFDDLKAIRKTMDFPSDPLKDPAYAESLADKSMRMAVLHGQRQAAMMDFFALATNIPDFSDKTNFKRDGLIKRLLMLDDSALQDLGEIFQQHEVENGKPLPDFGKPSAFGGMPIDYKSLWGSVVTPLTEDMALIKHTSHVIMHEMPGVG